MIQLVDLFGFLSVLLRAIALASQSIALGGIVFAVIVVAPIDSIDLDSASALTRSTRRLITWSAAILAVNQLSYVLLNSAMLISTADLSPVEVIGANFFVAGVATILAAVGIALLIRAPIRPATPWLLLLAVVVLGASVITSHAVSRVEHRIPIAAAGALHQAATASWIGGLPYLLIALVRCSSDRARQAVASRFSKVAMISVGVLAGAGIALSVFYIDSLEAVYGTAYGVMVLSKVALFGLLLALGGMNFYIVRSLRADASAPILHLRRFGEAEIGIGFTVILAAASLTSTPPAVDLTVDRVSAQAIAERMSPRWPRLNSPGTEELSEPTLQTIRKAAESGAPPPQSFVPGGVATHPNTPGDIAWSEYNHHWSGLIVIVIGLLALMSQSGRASWARHWPLVFVALAAFVFLRADPENWPLGPNGFISSFSDSEVLQHRAFVLLTVAFGVFEWAVRTGRIVSARASLVFPLLTSVGGALMLTHSHSLGNVQEELLAELTHVPLALLAVTAGWARWIELRLPSTKNRVQSWIWPVCFVLIGVLLVLYRES
ncbi:MAG TPA: CopD family protein [Blastocatellia bacterium]|nr:CopD family protein [Blastocatellia bacterium]